MTRPLLHAPRAPELLPFALALAGLPLSAQFTTDNTVVSWTVSESGLVAQLRTFDVEGDGDQDIFMKRFGSEHTDLSWYENLGQGTFAAPVALFSDTYVAPDPLDGVTDFDLTDIDSDGDLDIAYALSIADSIMVRTFQSGTFGPAQGWGVGSTLFLRWIQLDPWNDALPDLVTHREMNRAEIRYNIGGAFGPSTMIDNAEFGLGPDLLEVTDLSAAPVEFLVYAGGHLHHHTLAGLGSEWEMTDLGVHPWKPQVIDLDGDGDDDIAWSNQFNDVTGWLSGPGLYGELYADSAASAHAAGVWGKVNCDPYVDLLSLRLSVDVAEPYVSYGYSNEDLPALHEPVAATGLPVSGNLYPILVDLDEDGLNDLLMVVDDTTLHWYANGGIEPAIVSLPPLDTLCLNSSGYVLPAAEPPGGTWSGQGVLNGIFSATGLGTGDLPVLYEALDPNECAVAAATAVHVIYSPTVTSTPVWDPCSFIPVQFEGSPLGGEWIGLADANGVVQLTPGLSGGVEYSYTDVTGGTCTGIGAIINMHYPTQPNIGYSGPYCLNTEEYQVIPVLVGNPGSMSIYGWVDSVNFITTGLANIYYLADTIGLDTLIIASSRPGDCPSIDTLVIEVVAPLEVTLDAFMDTLVNGCAGAYLLTGGLPAGGTFSGDGVVEDIFNPEGLLGDIAITYTYSDGGCSGSATQTIHVIEAISVTPGTVTQCVSEGGVQLTVQPIPEVWFDAIVSPSGLLNTALPFSGAVYCAWTDVLGCQAYGSVNVDLTAYSEGSVSVVGQDPFPEQICASTDPFTIARSIGDGTTEEIVFDPLAEGLGSYEYIGYAFDDGSGCLRNDTLSFSVVDAPVVQVEAFPDTLLRTCAESVYPLPQGSPAGGTWSGQGVVDGVFHPSFISSDPTLTYTVDAGEGCVAADSAVFHLIWGVPHYPEEGFLHRCLGSTPVQYHTEPAGAVWEAPAAPDGYVDMLTAYEGSLWYHYTDAAGCVFGGSIETIISPYTLGWVIIPDTSHVVCEDVPGIPVFWSTADGSGGNTTFYPFQEGPGTYYFTGQGIIQPGPTQCYQAVTDSIIVLDAPDATLDLSGVALLTNDAPYTLTEGLPAGGAYAGEFVTDGAFDPTAAGQGWHFINYTVTNADLCSTTVTDSIYVELSDGVGDIPHGTWLKVWPVPTQDILQVSLPAHDGTIALVVTDARGREVLRNTVAAGMTGRTVTLGTTNLANGTYILFAPDLANTMPARIIIAR